MNKSRRLTIYSYRTAIFAILPLFAACGGESSEGDAVSSGSSGGGTSSGPFVNFGAPVGSGGTFTTDRESVDLKGSTTFDIDELDCSTSSYGFVGNQSVSVRNQTTGVGGTAIPRVNCALPFSAQWIIPAGILKLDMGSNKITATLNGGDTASITVIREADTTAPTILRKTPNDASSGFPVNTQSVVVEFSEDMDIATINAATFTLEDSAGIPVPAAVTYGSSSRSAFLRADKTLNYQSAYTVRITTGVTDTSGIPIRSAHSWSFTTEGNPDIFPPMITSQVPSVAVSCVAPDAVVAARFDEAIASASVTSSTFTLEDSAGTLVSGVTELIEQTATFTPSTPLADNETYIASLTAGIADLAGNALEPVAWTFTTERAPEGNWSPIATPASIEGRAQHSAVWTGSEMIIWGGYTRGNSLDRLAENNGRYDPALDQWAGVSPTGAPIARRKHTAIWTGSEMIVWGGATNGQPSGGDMATSTGGRYDPATDSWAPISLGNAPTARVGHTATWTGTEMLVWGGGSLGVNSGARYNPATDSWSPMSTINAPSARTRHHAIFDGQQLIVWGGVSNGITVSDGAVYDPTTDVWSALPTQGAPDNARTGLRSASVVWTGTDMLVQSPTLTYVWDLFTDAFVPSYESEGSRYSPQSQSWEALPDACDAAEMPIAVWLNGRMVSWTDNYSAGRIYDEAIDAWLPVTLFPGAPSENGSAVVVGNSVLVWGGKVDNATYSNLGYRLSF